MVYGIWYMVYGMVCGVVSEPSADHKRAIDSLQKRVDDLLMEKQQFQSYAAAQANDTKHSAEQNSAAARRVAELEKENQLLKWKNQVLLTCLTVRDLDYDALLASIGDASAIGAGAPQPAR